MTDSEKSRAWPQWLALIFIGGAIAVASYLLTVYDSGAIAGCSSADGATCNKVLASPWSKVFGVPVLYLGLILYVTFFVSVVVKVQTCWLTQVRTILAFVILGGVVWFVALQWWVIKAFCVWCCTAHLFAAVAALLSLLVVSTVPRKWGSVVMLSLVMVASMILAQVYDEDAIQFKAKEVSQISVGDEEIVLYSGALVLKRDGLPLITASESAKVGVFLSDFTCPHCRKAQLEFHQQKEELSKHLNLYFLPAYQNNQARELARLMLIILYVDENNYLELLQQLDENQIEATPAAVRGVMKQMWGEYYDLYWKSGGAFAHAAIQNGKKLMELNLSQAQAITFPQLLVGGALYEGKVTVEQVIKATESSEQLKVSTDIQSLQGELSHLVYKQAEFKVGKIIKGNAREFLLEIENTGEQDVVFKRVGVSCKCIEILKNLDGVAAGAVVKVPFKFHSQKFLGDITHSLFFWEEGTAKPMKIEMHANVWLPVKAYPLGFTFRGGADVLKQEVKSALLVNGSEPLVLKLGKFDSDLLKIELKEIRSGRHYELHVSLKAIPKDPLNTYVEIETSHPDCPKFKLPVRYLIK